MVRMSGVVQIVIIIYTAKYVLCCSAQTGQHEPCKGECCPVWVLQQICWISLATDRTQLTSRRIVYAHKIPQYLASYIRLLRDIQQIIILISPSIPFQHVLLYYNLSRKSNVATRSETDEQIHMCRATTTITFTEHACRGLFILTSSFVYNPYVAIYVCTC